MVKRKSAKLENSLMTMAYFKDLSDYRYHEAGFHRPRAKNIGWLAAGTPFQKSAPSNDFLDALWRYCKVSVAQMRGMHDCEICPKEIAHKCAFVEKDYETLLLGSAEIRVFSENGVIFAAPTLIYHYVTAHHYQPPEAFMTALFKSVGPPDPEYFESLQKIGLEWGSTASPPEPPNRYGAVKDASGVVRREEV